MAFPDRQFFRSANVGNWQSATDALETGFAFGYYGAFSDSTTQTITANTATAMTFNTTEESFGVSVGSPASRIVIANPGTYNVQFSAQLDKTDAGIDDVTIWLRIDGADVPRSSGHVTLRGNDERVIATWNWVYTFAAGQYFQLLWSSPDASIRLLSEGIGSSPTRPAVPSVILTATQVGAVR